ncbi:uncharacterized protein PODANS_1_11550 [Podospora anserina S mat+]|uniref:Podospora anserina S mat+ genomic DNA chromosome 1, supercontig 2 n=1 Tax=Podospora anserina (strain S / ATCC MYA-4624 / DSM 980 / FGSC 10383) TaxID=515849 RepID=B2AYL9_PODAN|nr:uncharacterized protein PODANS_1_11550 [Podospora anserina S mat+]CAP69493.1 unnamed protein product [Podospora anserina S mat+]
MLIPYITSPSRTLAFFHGHHSISQTPPPSPPLPPLFPKPLPPLTHKPPYPLRPFQLLHLSPRNLPILLRQTPPLPQKLLLLQLPPRLPLLFLLSLHPLLKPLLPRGVLFLGRGVDLHAVVHHVEGSAAEKRRGEGAALGAVCKCFNLRPALRPHPGIKHIPHLRLLRRRQR